MVVRIVTAAAPIPIGDRSAAMALVVVAIRMVRAWIAMGPEHGADMVTGCKDYMRCDLWSHRGG